MRQRSLIFILELLILSAGYAFAQGSLSVGTATGNAGSAVDLSVSFSAGSTPVSGFLFDLDFPPTLSYVSITTGAAAAAAGKTASANATSSGARIIVFGVNQNAVGTGPVATIRLGIAASAVPGTISVGIGNISASDPSGNGVTVSGSNGSVNVGGNVAPVITITSPTASGSYTTSSNSLTISGTASSAAGISQVTWTNSRGGSGTAMGTTSWSVSGIALQAGVNTITVTASDSGGNSATAVITVTYNVVGNSPPVITITSPTSSGSYTTTSSSLTISGTASSAAGISQVTWTNSRGGSGTAMGTTSWSASGIVLQAGVNIVTVTALDSGGNSVTAVITVTYNAPGPIENLFYYPAMFLPPLTKKAASQPVDEYTSVALINLDPYPAKLTFTDYDNNGVQLSGTGISNPVTNTLLPGGQMPVIDSQLFGGASMNAGTPGRIQVDSSTADLAGFFLTFNSALTFMDGAGISSSPISSFVFPEIEDHDFTRVLLSNPNSDFAWVRLDLMRSDGSIQGSRQLLIGSGGTLTADLFSELFPTVSADPNDYLEVSSSQGLLAYETLGKVAKDIAILPGQDVTEGSSRLYSPQYAVGGPWRSTLSIVNLDSTPGSVTLKLIGDDGNQIGTSKTADISAGGKVYVSDQAFFGANASNPGQIIQGYVEVTGSGVHLAGSVVFGDASQGIFSTALPLVSTLSRSIIFSQVASNDAYFTGLAIVNPNNVDARATIDLYSADGKRQASISELIPAGQRKSRLLTEYFPSLAGQKWTSGYFKVTADQGVASFALFGTQNLSVLSAIPGQTPVP